MRAVLGKPSADLLGPGQRLPLSGAGGSGVSLVGGRPSGLTAAAPLIHPRVGR